MLSWYRFKSIGTKKSWSHLLWTFRNQARNGDLERARRRRQTVRPDDRKGYILNPQPLGTVSGGRRLSSNCEFYIIAFVVQIQIDQFEKNWSYRFQALRDRARNGDLERARRRRQILRPDDREGYILTPPCSSLVRRVDNGPFNNSQLATP